MGQFMTDPEVDLVKMAEAQGAKGYGACRTIDEVDRALTQAMSVVEQGGVAMVDVRIEQISRVDAAQIKVRPDR